MRAFFRKNLAYADMVICQTKTMESRIRKTFNYSGKTLVTWKAVSVFVSKYSNTIPKSILEKKQSFKLLYVTRYYPHKGLEQLVSLFDQYRNALADCTLFITIEPDQHPNAFRLLKQINDLNLNEHIINLGKISQEDLSVIYKNCDALLMPTLLESFSGTYLEAMHFKIPILTSDFDFSREICADAAYYFNPLKIQSIFDAVITIRDNPDLRQKLINSGNIRLISIQKSWIDISKNILQHILTLKNNLT